MMDECATSTQQLKGRLCSDVHKGIGFGQELSQHVHITRGPLIACVHCWRVRPCCVVQPGAGL